MTQPQLTAIWLACVHVRVFAFVNRPLFGMNIEDRNSAMEVLSR